MKWQSLELILRLYNMHVQDFHFLLNTNLESAYHMCQLAHPLLKAAGDASIVFNSSVAGVVAIRYNTHRPINKYVAPDGICTSDESLVSFLIF